MPPVSVSISNLTKSFPSGSDNFVIRNLTTQIETHQIVGIYGPNGCGKSTLFSILSGAMPYDSGTIFYNPDKITTCRTGVVFQNYSQSLLPWRTCLDNVILPLERATEPGTTYHDLRVRGESLIQRCEVELPLSLFPKQMSGGQKQMACVMRALISDPGLLLLDEPFGALDYVAKLTALKSIEHILQTSPVTTLLVSHDIDDLLLLSDRIILLTRRPCRVSTEYPIELPRPRVSQLGTTEFALVRQKIVRDFIREASL